MSQVIPLGPAARMLTTREAAQRLGVSLRTVQLWVEASILPAARTPGGHRRIPYNAVEALALNMGMEPPAERPVPAQVHALPASGRSPAAARRPDEPLKIVLVSRDSTWLQACASAMEVFGAAVSLQTAENGYLGLLQIGRDAPDLLVTTLELPGMDGVEMLRTLERAESLAGLRVLALSTQSPAELAGRGGLPTSVELLPLPVSPEALAIRVGRWLLTRQSHSGRTPESPQGVHHE